MIFAKHALLPSGWAENVRLTQAAGQLTAVAPGSRVAPGDVRVDALVPGMPNVHSHAFQRGFSGLTETRGTGPDSFWTWRETMYRLALSVTPEDVQALAEMAYVEMLEAGFTRVGEFHYLHHDTDGGRYADPAELSLRIFAAAQETGIALTHLPVFYAHGGFGPVAADAGQRRFLHDPTAFATLVAGCVALLDRPQDRVGWAPHSLRAVTGGELAELCAALPGRIVHLHIAEQQREVTECRTALGARPVEWLLDNAPVGPRWCLVHATHLTGAETARLADSGAVAGLCPVTEANLGDGLFPAPDFLSRGGRIAIGTDSNLRIDVAEELRLLEYGQRLHHQQRNVLARPGGSTGHRLFVEAAKGGAQALDAPSPELAEGAPADMVALHDPHGAATGGDQMLDRWIFGRDVAVSDVWAAGRHLVRDGAHVARARIAEQFARVLRRAPL
ncbi:formimidoylglutamate deiminase [Pseudooceanicola aestuarii]|uniref:formimidoylglutamate deiminase n=1 Tax=Pseudooceanicola aestuarii TaxID=2697319 RepID=UPI0013D71DD1|nr:formimidoylglutamate deiminase [Pseudooceanicola aestuarii]